MGRARDGTKRSGCFSPLPISHFRLSVVIAEDTQGGNKLRIGYIWQTSTARTSVPYNSHCSCAAAASVTGPFIKVVEIVMVLV